MTAFHEPAAEVSLPPVSIVVSLPPGKARLRRRVVPPPTVVPNYSGIGEQHAGPRHRA
jgi:hypothetical protein